MDKSFERMYSINVAGLKAGQHQRSFDISDDFFSQFDQPMVEKGKVHVDLQMTKYGTHLDAIFALSGTLELACDRCGEPYPYPLEETQRIIYSFDKDMNFEGYEVMYVDSRSSALVLVQELYDFISLSVPIRKVPEYEVHLCDASVLALLGLDEQGKPMEVEEAPEEIDPRWEKLMNLKKKSE